MNTNIINQEQEAINILFGQIPEEEFYSSILTRAKVINIYEKYSHIVSKLPLQPNVVLRAILTRLLRYVNMSVQQPDVLLAVAVNNLTVDVLKMSIEQLIHHLIQENYDVTDVYVIERIVSQINNKLPYDLRPKFTPEQKIVIIKVLNNSVAFKENLKYFRDDAKQHSVNKFYITRYGVEGFTGDNKFTSLDNSYLKSLELDYNNIVNHNDWDNLRNKGYELKDYQDKVKMEIDAGTYEEQLQRFLTDKSTHIKAEEDNKEETSMDKILAMYVDKYPNLHYSPKDGKFYFYDHSSGTLIDADELNSEFNVVIDESNPKLSQKDKVEFVKMLKEYNIPKNKIDNAVNYIQNTDLLPNYKMVDNVLVEGEELPSEESIPELIIEEEDMTHKSNWILYLLIAILLLIIIIATVYYLTHRDSILNMRIQRSNRTTTTKSTRTTKSNKSTRVTKAVHKSNAPTDYQGKIKKMLKAKTAQGTMANTNDTGFRKL
jgi:hypothetical protein